MGVVAEADKEEASMPPVTMPYDDDDAAVETAALVGAAVRQARRDEGDAQDDIADRADTHQSIISETERGNVPRAVRTWLRIIDAVGYDLELVERRTGAR